MNIWNKSRLLNGTLLTTMLVGASFTAYAQDADPLGDTEVVQIETTEEVEETTDEVVVTGSRLRRTEFTSTSPLQVIDGELSRDLGLVDAADLLGQTTVVQGQQTTTGVSTSGAVQTLNGPGSATASLRGLDPGRTLVLINGRRLAPAGVRGVPSAPDLNLIPGSLVERVDVLLDGASSIYGSDAIAGVVNYNLRRDFDGLQLDAFTTLPELPGNQGHQQVFSATVGASSDKGFIGFAVEHSRADGYSEADLAEFYQPLANGCQSNVAINSEGEIFSPDNCQGAFGGGSVIGGGFFGLEEGSRIPGVPDNFVPIAVTGSLIQPDDINGQRLLNFPEDLLSNFSPDFERTTIFTLGEYDTGLYGDLTAYFEASHAIRDTTNTGRGQGALDLPGDYLFNDFGRQINLFYASSTETDTTVSQTRLVGGFRGELPFLEKAGLDNWGYDTYISYSRATGQDSVTGVPFFPRLEQVINNTTTDPVTGEPTCDSRGIPVATAVVECRPLDFLDPSFLLTGRFDDEADNAFLFPTRATDTTVEQTIYSAYFSGDLFDIPTGGTVLAGFGGEIRTDSIDTTTSLAGEFDGFADDPGSNGTRQLQELFGEIEFPLITDKPFIHDLTLNLAGRHTSETNFGSEETFSVKGSYSPTDWLTFRGTYGTSFRAPNLGEQFGGAVTGFVNPGDPCRVPGVAVPFTDFDNDPTTPDTRNYDPTLDTRDPDVIANCLSGGGPFGLAATDPFSLGVNGLGTADPFFFGSPTVVASGSNPELRAETSDALTLGVTFEQPWTEAFDLNLAVNYFEITVDDEVDSLAAGTIVNRCYQSEGLTDPTCAFITRQERDPADSASGEITFVSALNQNLGRQVVEGIDYNAELGFDIQPSGWENPIDYQLIFRATQSLTQNEEEIQVDATIINDALTELGNPEWRLNFTNVARWQDFSFLWQTRYIGEQVENLNQDGTVDTDPVTTGFSLCVQQAAPGVTCQQLDGFDDYWLHNASVSFARGSWVLRAGVNNVFDTAPPLSDNNTVGILGGVGYDLQGRTYFTNITKRF